VDQDTDGSSPHLTPTRGRSRGICIPRRPHIATTAAPTQPPLGPCRAARSDSRRRPPPGPVVPLARTHDVGHRSAPPCSPLRPSTLATTKPHRPPSPIEFSRPDRHPVSTEGGRSTELAALQHCAPGCPCSPPTGLHAEAPTHAPPHRSNGGTNTTGLHHHRTW
jgi:hypothetical protein